MTQVTESLRSTRLPRRLSLLARADRTNDEPLARAIAERAYEMDWPDVANAFLDSRPHLEERFTELWSQTKPSTPAAVPRLDGSSDRSPKNSMG